MRTLAENVYAVGVQHWDRRLFDELIPLPESTRDLGPGGYHQVGFTPRGDALVVSRCRMGLVIMLIW